MNLGLAKRLDRHVGGALARAVGTWDRGVEAVRAPRPIEDVRHVLLTKFWGLGNWALLRPIALALRARYPGARFTIATLSTNEALVADLADRLLLVRPRSVAGTVADLVGAVRALRRDPPDLALDFEQFARSGALLARLGRAGQRIGFRSGGRARDGLYTATVAWREDTHAARSFRDLAEAGGLPPGPYRAGGLTASAAGRREAAPWTSGPRYVVLHPGSGDNFPGRRWSTAGFAAVGRAAVAQGRRVLVTGGAGEREIVERTVARIGDGATALAGALSVPGLVALLAGAEALVSNDTGPVHLASQVGIPVLALFGPNTPTLYGPLSPGSRAFHRALPCSPCITVRNFRSSRCRIHTCMASIPVGEVVGTLRALLATAAEGVS